MKKEIHDIFWEKESIKPTFYLGLFWGCLLSIPLWALLLIVMWYIIKA